MFILYYSILQYIRRLDRSCLVLHRAAAGDARGKCAAGPRAP